MISSIHWFVYGFVIWLVIWFGWELLKAVFCAAIVVPIFIWALIVGLFKRHKTCQ